MANPFLDALDEYRRRDQPAAAPQPTAPLPTRYGEVAIPGGRLIDADTFTQGPEKFRVAGVDAPELQNKRTGEVLRPGQEAYRDAAPLFREPVQPDRTGVDIHGRSTARPLTADGRDLGAEMVRRGIAEPKDWNRSGVMPYVREAAARFDETHPPSEAAQAMAEFRGGKLSGKTIVPEPPDPKKRGYLEELGAGLKRGIDQGQSGLYGAVSMAGKLLSDESRGSDPLSWQEGDPRLTLRDRVTNWLQRVGNTGAMRNEEQAGQNPAAYSFDDVLKGKGDLLQWIAGSVGEAAPSTAIMAAGAMATGGVGALLEGSALRGTAGAALKELAVNAAEGSAATALRRKLLTSGILSDTVTPVMLNQVAKDIVANPVKYALKTQAAKAGGFLGAWGGSAALEGGSAWTEAQKALGPDADPRYSLGAGLAAGLLDTAALHVMLQPFAKAFATPVAEAAMATVPGRTLAEKTGSLVASIGKAGLRGILAEAPTEMAQEVIAAASVEAQKKSDVPLIDRLTTPDYIKRYIEAGAAGMAFGGLFSGVGGGVGHATSRTQPRGDTTDAGPGPDSGSSTATNTGPQPSPSPQTGEPTIAGASPSVAGSGSPSASGPSASPDITGVEQDLGGLSHPGLPEASSTGVSNTAPPANFDYDRPIDNLILRSNGTDEQIAATTGADVARVAARRAALAEEGAAAGAPDAPDFVTEHQIDHFMRRTDGTDEQIASLFGLPPEQIAARRAEIVAEKQPPIAQREQPPPVPPAAPHSRPVILPPNEIGNLPDPFAQRVERDWALANSLGIVDDVERLAAEGHTVQQIDTLLKERMARVDELTALNGEQGQERSNRKSVILAVRNKLGIPSMDMKTEYLQWLAAYRSRTATTRPPAGPVGQVLNEVGAPIAPPEERGYDDERKAIMRRQMELLAERERQGAAAPEELPPGVPPKRAGALARQAAEKAMAERTARATRITSLLDEIEKLEETNGDEAALPEQLAKSPNWMTSAPALAFIERHTEDLKPLFDAFHLASAADEDIGPFDETSTADVLRATWRHLNKDDFDREQEIRDYRDRRQQLEANGQLDLLAEREQQDVGAPEELPPGAPEELPPGARPDLPETGNRYLAKDRGKWARATKFIGRGSPASSTEKYADALGGLANSGSYTAEDRVFISAEGARGGRIEPDFAEIQKALDAGATIITDGRSDRERGYNIGERQVASFLEGRGYVEEGDTGVWRPAVAPESATPSAPREPASAEASARAPRVESHSNGPAPSGPNTARARGPAPSAEPRSTPAPVASNASPSPSPPEVGSPSVPPGSAARKGFAFAKQLSTAWGNLLGIAPIEPALTEAQARSLADSTDPRARYDAALDVARSTAKQFVFERWESAGAKIKGQIQKAYASRKSEIPFDAWLGEQVSQSLLHDEAVRRIYADANLPAVYRWLRDVGRSLLKLVSAFAKQFGYEVKEPNAAVAEWVRNAIDQERTRFAEQQGVSPETTRLLKEATNALLQDRDADATTLLDRIEQRLVEDRTGSLYRNWLTALRAAQKAATTAQIADELAPIKVRERMSAVLRDGLTKIDPWYALESFPSRKARREFLRQRASDYLSGLPALEKASPEAAEAARNVLKLAMQAEEALAVAGSFSRAVDHLPVRETKRVRGESMRDVASQSELVQNTDRARAVLKDKQKAPEGYMPPAGAKAALSAYWQALGFAAEDAPPLLPATESLDDAILGAHVAPYDDPVIGTRTALAEYVIASRALEGLPAAYRDSLVGAWRESGESDFADFLVNETDKVLASDAALYHVLYQATWDSADSAEQGKQLQIKRRTLNHLLGLALASKETPNPAVRDALRYRLRARYGSEALADADRLLGGIGVRNPWFLLGQGYSKTADGSPAFDAARRLKGQRILRDAHRLLASVPGLSDATSAERAAFLRDNLLALAEFDASFKALAPDRDAGGALVDWFDSLDKAMGQTDEQTVEAAMDEETVEDTDEEWEARAMADGANLADQEMFQEIEEANERKTTLTNTIALVSQYDPARGKLAPRLIRAFRSLPESTDGGTLLNSDETTDFAHTAPLDTPFEADFDHKVFRELPTALQHFLLQRGQLLGRMGVVSPEYRIKQHVTRNGRKVSYLEESMTLSDRATLHGGRLKDGSPIAERLAIDRAKDLLDDAARRTSRFSAATKYGSVPGGNFAALKFDVKAAIDHPLIGAIIEAFERDPGVREKISEVRAGWADGNRAALLAELDGLLPTVIEAFDLDPTLKSLSDSGSLVPLLVAAMGYDQDVFYGGGNPSTKASLNAPDLRPHERASVPRVEVRIDPAYAQELGLRAKPNAYGKPGDVYYSIAFARDERAALSAFLRMYATNFDAASGTIKTGATREVNGDALVGLGMRSLNGLDAAPSVHFSRVDSLYKGLDIASQLASPWVPTDPFWRSWSGISSAKTANDPHMGLIVHYDAKRDPNDQWTLGDEVSSRAAQQIIQGDSASSSSKTPFSEKSLYELDLAVQDAAARLDELRVRYELSKGASLGEQALADDGSPLWTYEGVLPPNVLWRAMFGDNTAELQLYKTRLAAWRNQQATKQGEKKLPKPKAPNLVEAKPWLRRFRGGKAAPSFVFEGQEYEARPFLGVDELKHAQAYRSKIRARIAELRSEMKEQYLGDRRMMGGSELNYAPNFEEEMSDIDSWLDDMGLGNNAARVNSEQALFNPDLNSPKVQWDADFKGHGYEGLRGLEAPGEQRGKRAGLVRQDSTESPQPTDGQLSLPSMTPAPRTVADSRPLPTRGATSSTGLVGTPNYSRSIQDPYKQSGAAEPVVTRRTGEPKRTVPYDQLPFERPAPRAEGPSLPSPMSQKELPGIERAPDDSWTPPDYTSRLVEEQKKDLPPIHEKPAPKEERYRDPSVIAALPEPRLPMDPAAPDFKVRPIPLPEPQSPTIDRLTRFTAEAARTMGLDPRGFKLTLIDTEALKAGKERTAERAFGDVMAAIGHAELAERAWRQAADEPVFVLFDGGVPHIVAFDSDLTTGAKLSEAFLRRAVAHELGHVYFDRHLKSELTRRGARTRLMNQLKDLFPDKTIETDLEIEEAVAEALADSVLGTAPPKQTVLGKIVHAVKSAWTKFFGGKGEDLSFMAAHNHKRAIEKGAPSSPSDAIKYYSGRKLLEDTKEVGKGTWATMKDLYSTVVRTSHSWLRSQLDAKGAPIDAFKVMADILRWTPGVAPESRSFGGQMFDFTSTDGDYRISYEQATQRHFARFGHRVEAMLDSWNPPSEKASFWDAKKRAEIAEAQRQRQVQAVRDYVNGVKTKQSVELGRLFDALGGYFGDVLKRYDPAKALPRIFDQTALRERKDDFLALLEGSGVEAEEAEQIWSRLTKEAGSDYRNDANAFFAPHFQRARMGDALDAISDKELLPFLLIDSQPQAALWQYVHQAVKRTEFERRFGGWVYFDEAVDFSPEASVKPRLVSPADEAKMRGAAPVGFNKNGMPQYELPNGKTVIWDHTAKWRLLRAEAAAQGATPGQLNRFLKITEAELGRLGADFSPRLRTLQSALVAGMNWAVLPLSLTSQVTDLALPLLRSNGDFASAWKGMRTALRELRKNGDLYAAAKANGVLAGNLRSYFASSYLDAPYMDSWAMKWNERLFKLNGMEKATEFVRMFAFATGSEWIKSLAAKNTEEANAQLGQLGLDRADVLAWQAGQEKLDTGEGAPDEASERVQQALDTFVEQSMFRPSASQRPTWASHPAAMLVWYLKSYIWAYADTILSRTWREFQRMDGYGQKALVLAMPALFMLPLAMLGLALRDELRDDLDGIVPWRMPKREREQTATDEIVKLIGRTGLLGPMQTLIDAGRASEYGSPYYLALIGPFATMTDQAIKRIRSAGEGKVTRSVAESLMQLSPVLGSLPQERRALADWAF